MGNDTATKIRVKVGHVEVDYEGNAGFLEKGFMNLLNEISKTFKSELSLTSTRASSLAVAQPAQLSEDLSTNTIAGVLGGDTGPNLALAAAAHLTLVKGMASFSRKDLYDEMKKATSYYKKSYVNNLDRTLKTLSKSSFNQNGSGMYALTAKTRKELEQKLAGGE